MNDQLKRVAVIGSNSFSGADFIDHLMEAGEYDIVGISRQKEKSPIFLPYKRWTEGRFKFYQLNLNKHSKEIVDLFDAFRPQYVVNFAAQSEVAPSWEHPEDWYQTNCVALSALLRSLVKKTYIERYLHISSPEVYGTCSGTVREDAPMNPSTPYAVSKAAADMHLKTLFDHFNFPVTTVRSTNVYGPGQQLWKIIPRSIIYIKKGIPIELHGGGTAVKSYIHIRDISSGEKSIMEHGLPGQLYHLSPANGISVKSVVENICQMLGVSFEHSTKVVEERRGQDKAYIIDSQKARNEFNWSDKISIDQGLRSVVEWVNNNWTEISQLPLSYEHQA